MALKMWRYLATLAVLRQAVAAPTVNETRYAGYASMPLSQLLPRQDEVEFDPMDLSFIKNLAAIGDSYSAGIGSGGRLGSAWQFLDPKSDFACSRYDRSYPWLVKTDPRFGDNEPNFQFLSCSGARSKEIRENQIPDLKSGQDAIMLSVGGNDVELIHVLNQCIYQFAALSYAQATIDEIIAEFDDRFGWLKDVDWEALGRGCDGQLERTQHLIITDAFSHAISMTISEAQAKLAPGGKIYLTGYAKFFNEELTPECDKVSWTTWLYEAELSWQPREHLTRDHRKWMNNLVDMVNEVLAKAAEGAIGGNVVFVDYDKYVGQFGGRFCEPGVDESTSESNTRVGLMFYELNTDDKWGDNPWKRDESAPSLTGTFKGDTNVFAAIVDHLDPEAKLTQEEHIEDSDSSSTMANMLADTKASEVETRSVVEHLLPDGYARVFHPQGLLHQLIANLVIWNMANVNEMNNGFPPLPQELAPDDYCPFPGNGDGGGDEPATAPDFYARILPLGASIMQGYTSSDDNGMRKHLRDALRQMDWKVNMVGYKHNGRMTDNNNEATPGDKVSDIRNKFKRSSKYQPNIVLINAGTNDLTKNDDLGNFANRYNGLLDDIFDAIPGVTIVTSTILPGASDSIRLNRDGINTQIRNLVQDRRSKNQKIVLTDVDSPSGYFTQSDNGPDGTHPTDAGYKKLASLFLRGIEQARREDLITEPRDTEFSDLPGAGSGGDDNHCDKKFGSAESLGAVDTQSGSGDDDGLYEHDATEEGVLLTFLEWTGLPMNITFARITGNQNDDLLIIRNEVSKTKGRKYHVVPHNSISGYVQGEGFDMYIPDTCIARGVRFVDVNGDGYDDMVCVTPEGGAEVSINNNDRTFLDHKLFMKSKGPKQDRVLLPDIDGDGRADFCNIADNGDIHCWRNGGTGDYPEYWQDLGIVFTGKGFGDVHGVRFADLNGDGRDDWMWVDDHGKTWTYTNNRGCERDSLQPVWRAGTSKEHQGEWTHKGFEEVVGRENIHFAKVFGDPQDFGLGRRSDYVVVVPGKFPTVGILVWRNKGYGATKLKADGDRYCNMMGHSNGAMDYVWAHSTGFFRLFEGHGGTFPEEPPYWGKSYTIWSAREQTGEPIDRRDLHLADWDGDGLCDVIYAHPRSGDVDVWINPYKKDKNFKNWEHIGGISTSCRQRRGNGIFDLAKRFADIDGNGRADYLCIEPNTRTTGWLNFADGLEDVGQVKKEIDYDRANIRWADVNGDGREDLLWINKLNGDTHVWYNEGRHPALDSSFTWREAGAAYKGAAQGHCQYYPDLDGNGRADMHVVDSVKNSAQTWFNVCDGEGGSDNGDDEDTLTADPVSPP